MLLIGFLFLRLKFFYDIQNPLISFSFLRLQLLNGSLMQLIGFLLLS